MKIRKKAFKIVIIIILLIVVVLVSLYFISHSTYYKYNDWWIIGNSYKDVEEKYGEFDREYTYKKAYYIETDSSIIMPSHHPQYYWMVHDENGIITDVYISTLPGG